MINNIVLCKRSKKINNIKQRKREIIKDINASGE
jgi:hypothetical protein